MFTLPRTISKIRHKAVPAPGLPPGTTSQFALVVPGTRDNSWSLLDCASGRLDVLACVNVCAWLQSMMARKVRLWALPL